MASRPILLLLFVKLFSSPILSPEKDKYVHDCVIDLINFMELEN